MSYAIRNNRVQKIAAAFVKAQERAAAQQSIVTSMNNGFTAGYGDHGLEFTFRHLLPALATAAAVRLAGQEVVSLRRVTIHAEQIGGAVIEYATPTADTTSYVVWELVIDEAR